MTIIVVFKLSKIKIFGVTSAMRNSRQKFGDNYPFIIGELLK